MELGNEENADEEDDQAEEEERDKVDDDNFLVLIGLIGTINVQNASEKNT